MASRYVSNAFRVVSRVYSCTRGLFPKKFSWNYYTVLYISEINDSGNTLKLPGRSTPAAKYIMLTFVHYLNYTSFTHTHTHARRHTEPTPGIGPVCSPQFVAVYREWDRSQWPLGLRRGSTAARWRRLQVRMPPEAWMLYRVSPVCQISGFRRSSGLLYSVEWIGFLAFERYQYAVPKRP